MKAILKSTQILFAVAFFIAATANIVNAQPGQITAPPGTSMIPSDYVDTTLADDPVFIFCSPNANGDSILGSLSVNGGVTNCSFQWKIFNPSTMLFENFGLVQTGGSSMADSLESGFYQVLNTQNPGMPNQIVFYRRAHVFVNETEVNFNAISPGCQAFTLTGAILNAGTDFVIYDPPPSLAAHTITNEATAEWSCFPVSWDTAWGSQDFALNPAPLIDPPPLQSTTFCLTAIDHLYDTSGVEITSSTYPQYQACEPQVCHLFETLPTDPSIVYYPDTICQDSPPVQLISLFFGGVWTANGLTWPNGPITTNGWFYPSLAPLGDNYISYGYGGVCADFDTVLITVVEPPVVTNVQEIMNSTNTHYQVQLTITGGSAATYQVLNCNNSSIASGNFVDSIWTSDSLPYPSSYCFIVSDASVCSPIYIQGSTYSNCTSSAGIMPTTLQEVCANDQTNVQVLNGPMGNPTYTLDANDGFEYFLHDNDFAFLGNIYGHNTTGIFQFLPSMAYGQTYYISQVVGNNIGTASNNIVDLIDTCLSVSVGTPVIWTEQPSPNAGQDDSICGLTIQLNADSANQGIGFWTCLSSFGVNYNPHSFDPQAVVTIPYFDTNQFGDLINTESIFRWTIENGPCQVYDEVTITFMPISDATIISYPSIICKNSPPVQLIPLNAGGVWSGSITWPPGPVTSTGMFYPSQAWLGNNTVTYSFSGACPDSETVIINVVDAPVVSNVQEICDNTFYTHYQISFTIVGGNSGSFEFINCADSLPFPGSLLGTTWTSMWLPNPSSYCIKVTDNNDCNPTIISNYFSCDPITLAGDMPTALLELCADDTASAQVLADPNGNPTYILDLNDGFEYFLHDNQYGVLGTVFAHNTTGIFSFQPTMVYGQTYYISQVVGNNIGTPINPVVDISDPAISVSQGTPVIWYQNSVANAGQNDSVCGNFYFLNAHCSGGIGFWQGPPNCVFSNSTSPQTTVVVVFFNMSEVAATFIWTEQNSLSTTSDSVTIVFSKVPVAMAGIDNWICGTNYTFNADILGYEYAFGTWICSFPTAAFNDKHDPTASVTLPNTGSYQGQPESGTFADSSYISLPFVWQIDNNGCIDEDSVWITFYQLPVADAGPDNSVYGSSYNMMADHSIGSSTGTWSVVSSPGSIPPVMYDIHDMHTNVQVSEAGLYTFNWQENNYYNPVCLSNDEVVVNFINVNGMETIVDQSGFQLYQNIPNPFTNETEISFYLPKDCAIVISIYNLLGKQVSEIISEERNKGKHRITFNSKNLPAGTYYYSLKTGEFEKTRKMIILK